MHEVFCFSCGREVEDDQAMAEVAICGRCRARHDGAQSTQLYVRRQGSPEEGPLTREAVEEQLVRGLLGAEDRVREEDGPWGRIDQHAWFSGFFIPGDARYEALSELKAKRAAEQGVLRRKGRMNQGLRFFIGAGGVFAVVGGLLSIPLWMADQRVQEAQSVGQEALGAAVLSTRKAFDDDAAAEALAQERGLPAQALVEEIQERWPMPQGAAQELLDAGWQGVLDGSQEGLDGARQDLEQAVALEPESGPALAALALVYAASSSPELHARSVSILDRAVAIAPQSAATARVRAGLALSGGSNSEALKQAELCLKSAEMDGICLWYKGRALSQLGQHSAAQDTLSEAAQALGDAPAVALGLGLASLEARRYDQAYPALQGFLASHPKHVGAQAAIARLYLECGLAKSGLRPARSAQRAQPDDPALRLLNARLEIAGGNPATALQLLAPLLEQGASQQEALLLSSIAARGARRGQDALRHAEALVALREGWAPGHMALAQARLSRGDGVGALQALQGAQPGNLTPQQAARFYFAAAEIQRGQGKLRESEDALRMALEQRPDWVAAQTSLAGVMLESGNVSAATTLLLTGWKLTPDPQRALDLSLPAAVVRYASIAAALDKIPLGSSQQRAAQQARAAVLAQGCVARAQGCEQAEVLLKEQVDSQANVASSGGWLAQLYQSTGRGQSARGLLDMLIASQGPLPSLLLQRGMVLGALKDQEGAKADLDQALKLGPGVLGVRGSAASALLRAGDVQGAVTQARLALERDSQDLLARSTLLAVGKRGR